MKANELDLEPADTNIRGFRGATTGDDRNAAKIVLCANDYIRTVRHECARRRPANMSAELLSVPVLNAENEL